MECILTQWSGTNGMEEMEMEQMDGWIDMWKEFIIINVIISYQYGCCVGTYVSYE